ncbi:MAG: type III pantothenate kinase [Tepidisphaeraceae bacterium]|jgi:type III pantothenate kinase
MDIDLMVLNVGNSRLGIGTFTAGELGHVTHVAHTQKGDWQGLISRAWARIASKASPAIAGASVNPALDDSLETLVLNLTSRPIQWVGEELELPIPVRTSDPAKTGVDRVLNIAAAHEQLGRACAVVDAGTAITVDCCNDQGEFLGGAIAPGLAMMLDALHEKTAGLPRAEFQIPTATFGNSTDSAICQGVYHGIRGMVRELVENYAAELGAWPEVVATGGDARQLFEGWDVIHAIAPELTLYGIALAYTNHHINHKT